MSDAEQTRSHETTTDFAAPPETIWKAITEADEIVRWFAPEAKVDPGPDGSMVGGTMWVSWGAGAEGTATIEIWEPNRHLRIVSKREGAAAIAVDYYLEAQGGTTILRLVHSGFGHGADWDGEYEGTQKGWPVFFSVLKHSVERHPGEAVKQIAIMIPTTLTPQQMWSRVLQRQFDQLSGGDRFEAIMPTGDFFQGTISHIDRPSHVTTVVENWNRALVAVHCENSGETGLFTMSFALYGSMTSEAAAIEKRWRQVLEPLLAP